MKRLHIAEVSDDELTRVELTLDDLRWESRPNSRLDHGMHIAMAWTRQGRDTLDRDELRRLGIAMARIKAREASPLVEQLPLGSLDYARMLVVDATIQKDAAAAAQLDVLDRRDRYSWVSRGTNEIAWVQTGTSPSDFVCAFDTPELEDMGSGRYDKLPGYLRENVELMLLRAASPRGDDLERALAIAQGMTALGDKGLAKLAAQPGVSADQIARVGEAIDVKLFGPPSRLARIQREEVAGIVNRLSLAWRAERCIEGSRMFFDPRPGRNPFTLNPAKEGLQYATVQAVVNGRVGNRIEKATRIALEYQQTRGLPLDRKALRRMERAVARLVSSSDYNGASELTAAKVLIVDTAIQKVAAEKLAGTPFSTSTAQRILEEFVSKENVPGFTNLPEERSETVAVAEGRFEELTDARGIASAVRTALFRAGVALDGSVAQELERISKANPVGKEADSSWVAKEEHGLKGRENLRRLVKGPSTQQLVLPVSELSR